MKKNIILKATELFMKLGFKSVTMDDIAKEMGISKKTIYTHFNNKEAIFCKIQVIKDCKHLLLIDR